MSNISIHFHESLVSYESLAIIKHLMATIAIINWSIVISITPIRYFITMTIVVIAIIISGLYSSITKISAFIRFTIIKVIKAIITKSRNIAIIATFMVKLSIIIRARVIQGMNFK